MRPGRNVARQHIPGRYIDFTEEEDDCVLFEVKMNKQTSELKEQMDNAKELDDQIRKNLSSIGYSF